MNIGLHELEESKRGFCSAIDCCIFVMIDGCGMLVDMMNCVMIAGCLLGVMNGGKD
ncbi:hypothetical protein LINPERPRIM_LOCUS20397 [Linum perenne]